MYLRRKYRKNWHIPPNISECTRPIFTKFSELHVNGNDKSDPRSSHWLSKMG